MDWIAEGRRRAQKRLQSMVDSAPTFTTPICDSADSAPGWAFLGEVYSCIPDVAYPWDPAVVRAIREFCPDAQPISIRTVWRSSRLDGEPKTMVLVRHGIARAISDPASPVHSFHCRMPSTGTRGLRLSTPNFIEVNWYDKETRPWGYDLPGAYLPFDWEFYQSLRTAYTDSLLPAELSEKLVSPYVARRQRRAKFQADEQRYRDRDLERYHQKKIDAASELEQKEVALFAP